MIRPLLLFLTLNIAVAFASGEFKPKSIYHLAGLSRPAQSPCKFIADRDHPFVLGIVEEVGSKNLVNHEIYMEVGKSNDPSQPFQAHFVLTCTFTALSGDGTKHSFSKDYSSFSKKFAIEGENVIRITIPKLEAEDPLAGVLFNNEQLVVDGKLSYLQDEKEHRLFTWTTR